MDMNLKYPLSNEGGPPEGKDFVDTKWKSGGAGPYKILSRGQIWPCILYKMEIPTGLFFVHFFLLYQVSGSTKS